MFDRPTGTVTFLFTDIEGSTERWESQANTAEQSDRGQNYIHHATRGRRVSLFVRTAKRDAYGRTMPYFCLGPATYVEHRSERPMQITWRLEHALPGDTFVQYRAAVA